jgi:hypothetical protein
MRAANALLQVEGLTLRPVPISSLKSNMAELKHKKRRTGRLVVLRPHGKRQNHAEFRCGVAGNWLLLSDNGCISKPLCCSAMKVAGHKSTYRQLSRSSHVRFLSSEKAQGLNGILHLWGMDLSEEHPDGPLLASLRVVQTCIENNVFWKKLVCNERSTSS